MSDEEFEKLLSLNKQFVQNNIQLPLIGYNDVFNLISKESNDAFFS